MKYKAIAADIIHDEVRIHITHTHTHDTDTFRLNTLPKCVTACKFSVRTTKKTTTLIDLF